MSEDQEAANVSWRKVRREWLIGLGRSGRFWIVVGNETEMERPHASCIICACPPVCPNRREGVTQKEAWGKRPGQGRRTPGWAWHKLRLTTMVRDISTTTVSFSKTCHLIHPHCSLARLSGSRCWEIKWVQVVWWCTLPEHWWSGH